MDIVALLFNRNKRFTVQQFERMSLMERDGYKKNIVCDECGGEAYYRSEARDGKTACFGAKHIDGCNIASNSKQSNVDGDEETNEFQMSSDFEVSWNYINKNTKSINNQDNNIDSKIGKNEKKYTTKPSIEKKSKIGLGTILKCAEYKMLVEQNYFIKVPDDGLKRLQDIVVNLEEFDNNYLNINLFLWGEIYRFNNAWIMTHSTNNIRIRIDDNIQEKFWSIYKSKFIKLLHDKKCLFVIYGKVKKSQKGNYYIGLNDMKYFYVRKSRI